MRNCCPSILERFRGLIFFLSRDLGVETYGLGLLLFKLALVVSIRGFAQPDLGGYY